MKPEATARQTIDTLLQAAGWAVQNVAGADLGTAYWPMSRQARTTLSRAFAVPSEAGQ